MYDPCGSQKLEGEEIIKRLAIYLGVDWKALKAALLQMKVRAEEHHERGE